MAAKSVRPKKVVFCPSVRQKGLDGTRRTIDHTEHKGGRGGGERAGKGAAAGMIYR